MRKQIKTSIVIEASKEEVWDVLVNTEGYQEWNPFIKSIKGALMVGAKIKVDLPNMSFIPKIVVFEKYRELKWLGHLVVRGVFDGEHQFRITDNKNGTITFEQNELFMGVLSNLLFTVIEKDTKKGFEAMNNELKYRVEQKKKPSKIC